MKNATSSSFVSRGLDVRASARRWAAVLVCWVTVLYAASSIDVLQASFVQRWGVAAKPVFDEWRQLLQEAANSPDLVRLRKANDFFNQRVRFADDSAIWGQADYWATPLETLGRGSGDCEDYAIAKYFTLVHMGVPAERLRLVYVRAQTGFSDLTQAHMVLAYDDGALSEPLLLDNLIPDIRPASRRPDLQPVFGFNRTGMYSGALGGQARIGGPGPLSRWQDLLRRTFAEGFE